MPAPSPRPLPSPPKSLCSSRSTDSLVSAPSEIALYQPLRPALLHALRDVTSGRRPGNVHRLKLSPAELNIILRTDGCFNDRARFSFAPRLQQLTIYMPTLFHETIAVALRTSIVSAVTRTIADLPASMRDSLPQWKDRGSPTLSFPPDPDGTAYGSHCPDSCLWVRKYIFPSLTIEVSYTQRLKDLEKVADDCVLGSNGRTIVIGVDAKDNAPPSIHAWKLSIDPEQRECKAKEIVHEKVQTNTGEAVSGKITLRLSDIFSQHITPGTASDLPVDLSFHDVSNAVNEAREVSEEVQAELEALRNSAPNSARGLIPAGFKKRKREKTPPEELSPRRESKYQAGERDQDRRAWKVDKAYRN